MKRQHDEVVTTEKLQALYNDLCQLKKEYQTILDSRPAVVRTFVKSDAAMQKITELLDEAHDIMSSAPPGVSADDKKHELSAKFCELLKLAENEITRELISMKKQNVMLELQDLITLLNEHPHEYHYLRMIGMILQKYYDEQPLLLGMTLSDTEEHHVRSHITRLRDNRME